MKKLNSEFSAHIREKRAFHQIQLLQFLTSLSFFFFNFSFLLDEFTSQDFCQRVFEQKKLPEQKTYKYMHSKTHCKNTSALAMTTKLTWQFLLGTGLRHAFYYIEYA